MKIDEWIMDHHTRLGTYRLSGGGTAHSYLDLRAALLCPRCKQTLVMAYQGSLARFREGPTSVVIPVGTGAFGGLLLGAMAPGGLLWNPKGHGIEWSGLELLRTGARGAFPPDRFDAALIDDVKTTGETLRRMAAAVEGIELRVIGEVYVEP